jgi:glycosyltransferase involved in cell wall biosynthesis
VASSSLTVLAYTDAVEPGGAEVALSNLLMELPDGLAVGVMGVDRDMVEWVGRNRPSAPRWVVRAADHKWDVRGITSHLRAIREIRPQILHANLRVPWACSAAVAAGLAVPGVEVVAVEQLPLPLNDGLQRHLKRASSRRLGAHVAVGARSARELERDIGLPDGSIQVVHNGVPELDLTQRPRVADGPVLGSLGRLQPQKGYDVLVRSLADLPGVHVVLVGDGDQRAQLERLADELGVSDRLHILGWKDDPRSYLTSFDLFVLPSRYEGFPLSIVEAMQSGLPIVASDVGSIAEALDDERAGVLVAPDDPAALTNAIRELLGDDDRRARLGAHAREIALARHTSRAMASGFESVYESLSARRRARGAAPAQRA